jgi:hypothetical protein
MSGRYRPPGHHEDGGLLAVILDSAQRYQMAALE